VPELELIRGGGLGCAVAAPPEAGTPLDRWRRYQARNADVWLGAVADDGTEVFYAVDGIRPLGRWTDRGLMMDDLERTERLELLRRAAGIMLLLIARARFSAARDA
jgi:hypothetical protein